MRRAAQRRTDRRRRRLSLLDCLALTAIPLLLAGYVVAAGTLDYYRLLPYTTWWPYEEGRRIDGFLRTRLRLAAATPRAIALDRQLDPADADPGVVRLRVRRDAWDRVFGEPQAGWGEWIEGLLVRGNETLAVELRKRGDSNGHWTRPKKSFTLKTPRDALYKGYRRAAFSVKDVLPLIVTQRVASEFDVLVPFTTAAPVFLNDRYYGIHRMIEPVDESFLRRHGRMPGNVFRHDAASRGESFPGTDSNGFLNPYLWDRVADDGEPDGAAREALIGLLAGLNGTTFEDHLAFRERIDVDETARFLAALLVTGDLHHMDDVHNQYWFEDPSTGRMHPIVWDLYWRDLSGPAPPLNRFLQAVLRDPFVTEGALRTVRERADRLRRVARAEAAAVEGRYRSHIAYDRLREGLIRSIGDAREAADTVARNLDELEAWARDSRTALRASPAEGAGLLVDLESRGRTGSDLVALELAEATARQRPRLFLDRDGNGRRDERDPEVRLEPEPGGRGRFRLEPALPLLAGWDAGSRDLGPGHIHYRLFLELPPDLDPAAARLRLDLRNRITGEPGETTAWPEGATIRPATAWSPWRFPSSDGPRTIRLDGHVRLGETLEIAAGDRLVVAPGARLVLDPDVSIVARGRVEARGTRESPIRLQARDASRPWGSLVLQGAGADGSVFEHVQLTGGGGARVGGVEYKGMLSVHHATGVRFAHSTFADNLRSDDALNVVHAEVEIRDCTFLRANADAVDFDYSSGVVSESRFERPGNDAIDLMTSSVRILDNRIAGCGDKGVSVGEDSHPLVFNNVIESCPTGIEVKDRSEPVILHNRIAGSDVAVLTRAKNWRYGGGGHAMLFRNDLGDNRVDVELDARSNLTLPGASRDAAGRPVAPAWIYARHGIAAPADAQPGPLAAWSAVPPAAPLELHAFRDDFAAAADGWRATGGAARVAKRGRDLVATFRKRPGRIERSVDWDLAGPDGRHAVVLEYGGRALDAAALVLESDEGSLRLSLEPTDARASHRIASVVLPAARYRTVAIEASPLAGAARVDADTGLVETRAGRLALHRLWVQPLPERAPHAEGVAAPPRADRAVRPGAGRDGA